MIFNKKDRRESERGNLKDGSEICFYEWFQLSISNEITRGKAGGVRVENAKIFRVTVKTGLEMSISEEWFRLSSLETRLERQGRDGKW